MAEKYIDKIMIKISENAFEEVAMGTTSDLVFVKDSEQRVSDQIKILGEQTSALEEQVSGLQEHVTSLEDTLNNRILKIERLLELAEQDPEAEPIITIEDRLQLIEENLGLQAPEA